MSQLLESTPISEEPVSADNSESDHLLLESEELSGSWWSRRCGGKEVISLALPLMISTFSYSLMQFCDRMFLGSYSQTSLAAVMPAGVMSWTLMSFPFGVALYTNVFVAQYFGAGRPKRIASVLWHGLILAACFLPIFIFSAAAPQLIFQWAGHGAGLVAEEATYFRFMAIGSIGHIFGAVLTSFYIGQGRTWLVMIVDVSAALLNIVLDWLLIFGFSLGSLSVSPLGIKGAAIATAIALWCKAAVFVILIFRKSSREQYGLFDGFQFQPSLLWRMLRFGSSNGFQFLIECLAIAAFSLMIGRLGEIPAAATTVAISVNMMVFVPIFGLSTAVSTLVGQQIGEGKPELAARATWTSLQIGLLYTSVFGIAYLMMPGVFLLGYEAGVEDFEQVRSLAVVLLMFVAAYCIFDSVQIVFVGAIKGAGDTLFVVLTTIVCAIVFVLIGWTSQYFCETDNAKLFCWWTALTSWIVILSIVFGLRFIQGRWKDMRVIEHKLDD